MDNLDEWEEPKHSVDNSSSCRVLDMAFVKISAICVLVLVFLSQSRLPTLFLLYSGCLPLYVLLYHGKLGY